MAIENGSLMSVKKLDGQENERDTKDNREKKNHPKKTVASLHSHLLDSFSMILCRFFRCFSQHCH